MISIASSDYSFAVSNFWNHSFARKSFAFLLHNEPY